MTDGEPHRSEPHLNHFIKRLQTRITEISPRRYVEAEEIKTVCGVDISYCAGQAAAAAVLRSISVDETIEISITTGRPSFPYIPGLLFMREAPLMTSAVESLSTHPDLILVDGHGIAHPRRAGLAVFVGLVLDTPSIGVAKSRLVGDIGEDDREGFAPILLEGSPVGFRLNAGGRRLFVSPGYGVRLGSIRAILRRLDAVFLRVLLEADRRSRESLG